MTRRRATSIALFVVAGSFGCADDVWRGFIYPDRGNLLTHVSIGSYSTVDDCRAAAQAYLRGIEAVDAGDYECGKNCRPSEYSDLQVCQETSR